MRFNIILLAVFVSPFFLAGCGGSNTNPYDGTWQAVYPALSKTSTISDTKTVICDNPPAALVITDSKGTVTISATCVTTTYTISTDPTTGAVTKTADTPITETYIANTSVSIVPNPVFGEKDILNAIVNGVTFTGQCISTIACSAVSVTGETLSLTR